MRALRLPRFPAVSSVGMLLPAVMALGVLADAADPNTRPWLAVPPLLLILGAATSLAPSQAVRWAIVSLALAAVGVAAALSPQHTTLAAIAALLGAAGFITLPWAGAPMSALRGTFGSALLIVGVLQASVATAPLANGVPSLLTALATGALGFWLMQPTLADGRRRGGATLPWIAPSLQAGIALLVLLGWLSGASAIVQGGTGAVPMQFNTALCHLLAAAALWSVQHGYRRLALGLLLPVLAIAIPALAVEAFGWDIGIDQLLFAHPLVVEGVPPGRMAPNSAIAFLVGSAGIALLCRAPEHPRVWVAVWGAGLFVSLSALIVLAGYLLGVPAARAWGAQTPMALMTALGFSAQGAALLLAGREGAARASHQTVWLPLMVFCGAIILAVQLGVAVQQQREALVDLGAAQQADSAARSLSTGLQLRADALRRFADRLARFEGDAPDSLFDRDGRAYLSDFPSITALIWLDEQLALRRQLLRSPATSSASPSLAFGDPANLDLLRKAQVEGAPLLGSRLNWRADGPLGLMVIPLRGGASDDGMVVTELAYGPLLEAVLEGHLGQALQVRQGDTVLYRGRPPPPRAMKATRPLSLLGQRWELDLWLPRPPPLDRITLALLAASIVAGAWLALALRFAGLARLRAEQAESHRNALEQQLAEGARMRSALDESERELTGVLESISDAFYLLDSQWRYVFVNAEAARLQGRSREELLGRTPWELFPESAALIRPRFERAVRDGTPYFDELHYPPLDRWFEIRAYPHRRGLAVYFRDITTAKRHALEQAKRRAEAERAQRLASLGSWEYDIQADRLLWSPQTAAIFGLPEGYQPAGVDDLLERVHPDDRAALRASQLRANVGAADIDLEYRIQRPDGTLRHVHELGTLLRDGQGEPMLVTGAIQDITDRKHAERALQNERRFLRALLENLAEGVVACDANGVLSTFNRATRQFHGLPEAPLAQAQWARHYSLFHLDGRPLGADEVPLARALRGESVVDVEMLIAPAGGLQRIVVCNGQRIVDDEGVLLGAVVAMHDITAAKRAASFEAGQREVLTGIAARLPLVASLAGICRLHEQQFPDSLCSVLLLDESGKHLLTGAAPSLPEAYVRLLHGEAIGPRAGSCGTAAYTGQRVVVADIASDPRWTEYAPAALAHGLRACWSTPVLSSDGRVVATLAVYYREVRTPSDDQLAAGEGLAAMAAIAIEQGRAFRSLSLSEQRFRSLFDEHPDAVYSMDLAGRFTACNAGFERLGGRPAAEVIGRFFDESIPPAQRAFVRQQFTAAARGEARTFELRIVLADGSSTDLRSSNLPIVVDGDVVGVFGVAHDIGPLRQRERELAQALGDAELASARLRRLGEASLAVAGAGSEEAIAERVVTQMADVLPCDDVVLRAPDGRRLAATATVDDWATPTDLADALRLHGAELQTAMAETLPAASWLGIPLLGSSALPLGQLELRRREGPPFGDDELVIARQLAQLAAGVLERSRLIGRLRERDRFFEMAGELFCIFDAARGRFLQVNPAFVRLLGYPEQDLLSRPFTDFVHPADHASSNAAAREVAGGGVIHEFVNRYLCADGSLRWLEWTAVTDDRDHTFCVARDITERRRTETALQQAFDDLGVRNRELQDFAFVASHDLQEPLRKIRAFSDRLLARYGAAFDEQARDYLTRSGQAAARMQVLIDDLLAYSRVSSRGRPFAEVDLDRLVGSVLEDLEARIESSGGKVEVGPLPRLDADATQLRQVLQNLIANALKFRARERAPRVRIHAERRTLEGDRPGWALVIEDNGIGFEQKYADRIFGPFQRLHGRQDYEGTGIGLAIVRRIVERHRGSVEAAGRPGEGARFVVILPERQPIPGREGETPSMGGS